MTRFPLFFALLLPVATPIATPAAAQEVLGTIEARQGHTLRTWFVTRDGAQSQSAWQQVVPGLIDVSLWGHATDDTATSVNGALILDFDVMTAYGAPKATEPTMQYLSEGYSGGWLALDDDALSVTIESFENSGSGLAVQGTFTATLTYSPDLMKLVLDPSRTQTVEGRFSAVLP